MWIQGYITLFLVYAAWRLVYNYRARKSTLGGTLVWLLVWCGVGIIVWSPEIASRLAVAVGIGRGSDLIVYVSIIILIYLAYRIFVRIEKIERDLTSVTRALALYDERKRDHSSDPDRQL